MTEDLTLAPYRSLDAAIQVTKRLQRDAYATLIDVDNVTGSTTIHLSIPVRALPGITQMRRELWISFVDRNLRSREELASMLDVRITRQREAVQRVRQLTEETRRRIEMAGSRLAVAR